MTRDELRRCHVCQGRVTLRADETYKCVRGPHQCERCGSWTALPDDPSVYLAHRDTDYKALCAGCLDKLKDQDAKRERW